MRQIHVCAWLLVICVAEAACGGEKFSSAEQNGTASEDPTAETSAGTNNRGHAGSSSSAGSLALGSGGSKSTSGGTSSAAGTATSGAGGSGHYSGGTSSGGASSSAGSDAGDACPEGTITFQMLPSPDLMHDFLCDAGCGTGWLTLTDAEGATAFSIFSACGTASCETCEQQACAASACVATPLTAEGSKLEWSGTYMAKGTCGANMACQQPACVKPGKYKAKACAAINGGANGTAGSCTPKNEQLCAEAVFDFPSTQTVKLVLKK
jgi:hypothetical protein